MTEQAINAAWPAWWSDDAAGSSSASTELRFTLARRLGLSPTALLRDEAHFIWRDEARFKSLTAVGDEATAIASFGVAFGKQLIAATPPAPGIGVVDPLQWRSVLLGPGRLVDFDAVVLLCWSVGVPVVYVPNGPTARKRMHAMSVSVDGRYAIIVSRRFTHRSHAAYTIAHELGHCALGHLASAGAIVDVDDPARLTGEERDSEEVEADEFALSLLTGSARPEIASSEDSYFPRQLARAAMEAARVEGVDAGVLALCLGHATGNWRATFGALKHIPPGREDVGALINQIAWTQLDTTSVSEGSREYLQAVIGAGES